MPADLERKRARDLARYHRKRTEGTHQRSKPQTAEQLERAQARQERAILWREVGRAFERFMRLPAEVQDRVLTAARA